MSTIASFSLLYSKRIAEFGQGRTYTDIFKHEVGHLAARQSHTLIIETWARPGQYPTLKEAAADGFGFDCDLNFRFTSSRDNQSYEKQERLHYNPNRNEIQVNARSAPRLERPPSRFWRSKLTSLYAALVRWEG
jgi:hypothetical protein